ncbi:hypothetical protein NC652_009460 [Populus alba x Populus x berolinensis]|uniref:Uncharacterized protein n=1 Tax=Populus alba x Populus x berolinensis TaxID=444605 RepID=A0AAD6RAA7_9ROSI|nr:hypothetical protein NC652_009460 [Populus alba x Populus x berolinensis]KAJ7004617.1 hypothetical protein NC653_009456 [Populus alba x Populus x berolinensis]
MFFFVHGLRFWCSRHRGTTPIHSKLGFNNFPIWLDKEALRISILVFDRCFECNAFHK